ncbi:MAG: S9 family peptidase [Myxococcales bacterium]|nr:S9 family peptidase [Myxococcales bacterium]
MRLAGWVVISIAACGSNDPEPAASPVTGPVATPVPNAAPAVVEPDVNADPDTPVGDAVKREAELAVKLAPFVDAFTNTEPSFTADGKQLMFVSSRDGVPQIYVADRDGPARRIVTSNERMVGAITVPGSKDIVFSADIGFDEQFSFFRVGLDGKDLIELTPDVKLQRVRPLIPENRPNTLLFSARKLNKPKTTIYSMSTRPVTEPKPIYSGESLLVAVSPDGKVGLVSKAITRTQQSIARLDLETGELGWAFPSDRHMTIFGSALTRDGKRVLVATEDGSDQVSLLALDLATGKELARHAFTPAHAQVNGMEEGKMGVVAVMLTVGNHRELRLLDTRTLAERTTAALPPGSGSLGGFSPDGKQVLVSWSAPDAPNEIYIVDTKTGRAEPRHETRPASGVPEIELVSSEITSFDGTKVPTHVYLPRGETGKKHPVIVEFHGGPMFGSLLRWDPSTAFFVSLGYAIVEPNIRGSTGYGSAFEHADDGPRRPDSFKDIEAVTGWIKTQPWADGDRLVAFGASYGGYLTLLALTNWPKMWRAGIGMAAFSDLITFLTANGPTPTWSVIEFGDPEKDADFLKSISPLRHVDQIVAPLFIYQGLHDPRVPKSEADQMVHALRRRKVQVEYMLAENEGHSRIRRETLLAMYPRMARFLETALK